MKTSLHLIGICTTWLAAITVATAQVPPMISYQGRVKTPAGTLFTGTGHFQFALVDGPTYTYTYWSNDGAMGAGAVPAATAIVPLPVNNGVYSVYLGNASGSLAGMTANIPPWIFTNSHVFLRVWFSDGSVAPALTTPDTRIVSVGYAMIAATVVDGNITEAKLADGCVTSKKLAAGAITTSAIADASVTADKLAIGSVTGRELADEIQFGSVGTGAGLVEIYSGQGPGVAIKLDGSAGSIRASDAFQVGATQAVVRAESSRGVVRLYNEDQTEAVTLQAKHDGGDLSLYQRSGLDGISLIADPPGGDKGGQIKVSNGNGNSRVALTGDSDGAGLIEVKNPSGNDAVTINGAPSGDPGGYISIRNAAGDASIRLNGAEGADDGGEILLYNPSGVNTLEIDGDDPGSGGWIGLWDANRTGPDDKPKIELDANASGGARITTQVLEITGGSDLSEHFDITFADDLDAPRPGLIVCIDPDSPGQLIVSSKAYDRTVAGIVSGAGGVKPGMLMGQHGTAANGKHPVALTGRVYCQADASNGAIQPGDLLTTSGVPGHAMKVTDHARAQGAIIGKAMTPLGKDRGLVLVLVCLQ